MYNTASSKQFPRSLLATAVLSSLYAVSFPLLAQTTPPTQPVQQKEDVKRLKEVVIIGTAEEEIKQMLGVSTISAEDLEKRPAANDISELLRTQPGVNLTGSSSSGQYGNNRQIDLRGMGPENTLILVDGKPIHSRDGVRMGRSGERDTRGDTNWVPAESIERIEIIRGPAAARYGSGAAGGVVNIITKKPGNKLSGTVSAYADFPGDSDEQKTRRLGFNLSGPLAENLSFRLFGNIAKTSADSPNLNADASGVENTETTVPPAGREGVRNRDINALIRWDLTPGQVLEFEGGVSRQGNIYTGERPISGTGSELISDLANAGAETNSTLRRSASVTHRGTWDIGTSRVLVQYEGTDRSYLPTGLAGSSEGSINATERVESELENLFFNAELNTPLQLAGMRHVFTWGTEARRQKLDDAFAMSQGATSGGGVPGLDGSVRSSKSSATSYALYVEDNFELFDSLITTPGLRFDHTEFGNNWSPSLNLSYLLTDTISIKGGLARAFKAPNLYQSNPNYLYFTMGNGCPTNYPNQGGGCYIQGNASLVPETSVNKEIGIAYNSANGFDASLTFFRNDYKNKIHADMFDQGDPIFSGTSQVFKWANASKAVVQGFEGNLNIPLLGNAGSRLKLINNFTYMNKNKNINTDQPLSIIPKYTINSTLDWRLNDQFSAQLNATFYGKQEPRSLTQGGGVAVGDAVNVRESYHLLGLAAQYVISKNLRTSFGVKNLLDKRLFRESVSSGAGAATYNEPGRSYYVTLTASF